MKFIDIIKSNPWLIVELTFLQLYPEEKRNMPGYEKIFNELMLLQAVEPGITILVKQVIDDFDNEEYVDVSGYYNDPKQSIDDLTDSLALEFTPWDQWLGMDLDEQSLLNFTELEFICHCLFEMTFFGFEQTEIQEEMNRINDIVDEIETMTEDEKKEKLLPFDEVTRKSKNKGKDQ